MDRITPFISPLVFRRKMFRKTQQQKKEEHKLGHRRIQLRGGGGRHNHFKFAH